MVHTKTIRIRNYVRDENKDDIFGKLNYSNVINNYIAFNKVLSEIVLGKNTE